MVNAGRRVLMPHALVDDAGDTLGMWASALLLPLVEDVVVTECVKRDDEELKNVQKGEKVNSVRVPMYKSLEVSVLMAAITSVGCS
jgi:hypothetical protein